MPHSSSTPWRPSDPLRQRRGSVPGSATRHDSAATPNARSTRAVWALVTTISDADCSARLTVLQRRFAVGRHAGLHRQRVMHQRHQSQARGFARFVRQRAERQSVNDRDRAVGQAREPLRRMMVRGRRVDRGSCCRVR